jgi:ribosomal protein S18 acetylase RimI-like enzyme
MNIAIRDYRDEDFPRVVDLIVQLQEHEALLDPYHLKKRAQDFDGQKYTEESLKDAQQKNGLILLAVLSGEVVGLLISSDWGHEGLDHYTVKAARIEELVVKDSARSKGIGKKLLEEAEQRYTQREYQFLRLSCFVPNTHAGRFYKNNGYEERSMDYLKKL